MKPNTAEVPFDPSWPMHQLHVHYHWNGHIALLRCVNGTVTHACRISKRTANMLTAAGMPSEG